MSELNRVDKFFNTIKNNKWLAYPIILFIVFITLFRTYHELKDIFYPKVETSKFEIPILETKIIFDKITDSDFHFMLNITNQGSSDVTDATFQISISDEMYGNSGDPDDLFSIIPAKSSITKDEITLPVKFDSNGFKNILFLITYYDSLKNPHNCYQGFFVNKANLGLQEYNPNFKKCENRLPDTSIINNLKGNAGVENVFINGRSF